MYPYKSLTVRSAAGSKTAQNPGKGSADPSLDGLQIHLDSRPVRTPSKETLRLPRNKHHLATAVALEWDNLVTAQQALKQHYIPLTSMTARALDIENADRVKNTSIRDSTVQMVMSYLKTDTLLCWAPKRSRYDETASNSKSEEQEDGFRSGRESLRERQMNTARPIISFLTTQVWPGVELNPALNTDSILPTPQPEMTAQVIRGWVSGLPAFELAGIERAVLASKSLCIAARFLVEWSGEFASSPGAEKGSSDAGEKRFGIEEAAEACSLEVRWQTQMWGEVEDSHDVDKEVSFFRLRSEWMTEIEDADDRNRISDDSWAV